MTEAITGEIGPNEFQIGEGICEGDSGGPAVDDSTRAVLGLVSRGGNNAPQDPNNPAAGCLDGNGHAALNIIYTRIDGWRDFVLSAFQEAGHDPWEEGGPDPRKAKAGETCASNDDCRSALCITAGGQSFCSTSCDPSDASTCSNENTCQMIGGQPACAPPPPPKSGGCSMSRASSPNTTAATIWLIAAAGLLLLLLSRRARR